MVRQAQPPEADTSDDLENTSELPCLDLTAYGEQVVSDGSPAEFFHPDPEADAGGSLPVLPAADTLQDIEAWITAQDARSQAYQRSLAELRRARTEAHARAENLAIELRVAQQALHTALCRANDGERVAIDKTADARAAQSRAEQLQHELAEARRQLAGGQQHLSAGDGELYQLRAALAVREQAHTDLHQRHEALAIGASLPANARIGGRRARIEPIERRAEIERAGGCTEANQADVDRHPGRMR